MPEAFNAHNPLLAPRRRLAWLPVPLFFFLIVALRVAGEGESYEAPFLLLGLNFTVFTLVSLVIASLMGRSFTVQGKLWQLLLGCGVLIWGALGSISVAAGIAVFGGRGLEINTMVTTYNSCVFFAALCHFASALSMSRPGEGVRNTRLWLAFGYLAALGAVSFIAFAAMAEWIPPFFIQGEGGTPLRQVVVVSSIALFLASAVLLWKHDRRSPSPFSHWYTIALVLISVGLIGVTLQTVMGSLLNWTARIAQSLGSLYMLVSALASVRESGTWTITLEAALVDAKQQFEELFELAADGIVVHEIDDAGRWSSFMQPNSAFCGMLGYSIEEMRALSPYDVVVPEEQGEVAQALDKISPDGILRHERTLVTRDGRRISTEINTRLFRQSGRRMVMSMIRDVTARKQTEQALAETVEKLRLFFEYAPAAVAMFDREMRYIHCSRRWLTDFDMGERDITGLSHYELFPEIPEHWKEVHQRCLAGATESSEEDRFQRQDGSGYWLRWQVLSWRDSSGSIGGLIITSEDITARKEAEIALNKAHDELKRLVQERTTALDEQSRMLEAYFKHSVSPLVFLDREFNFIRVNEAYARSCGRNVTDYVGRNHFVEYPSDELRERFETVVSTKEPYSVFARPFVYPDDPEQKVTYWDLFVHPILDKEGEVDFLVFSLTDVTERKLAEDALRDKDYLLLQQSRQAAMGEMINNIAHQWRQPLNTLGLNIQRLPLFYEIGHFNKEFLEGAVDDAMALIHHMSQTIDDFRAFFRPDREKEDFHLGTAIDSAVKLVDATFKSRNICIITEYKDDPVASGYANAFSQVIVNLLNNAKDAFETRQVANARVIIALRIEAGRPVVTITDNAGGIPEDLLFKIFDPHFTTKGPQGTGIGLFMAKNIIERNMHGRLTARNCADGAEFRIEL